MEGTRQDHLAAMALYSIAFIRITPTLMETIQQESYNSFTAIYADDLTAAEIINYLKKWWDVLYIIDPKWSLTDRSKSRLVIRKNVGELLNLSSKRSM